MIEDEFYATIKLITGEEIFARVAASEEEDRTMLILTSPVTIEKIKNKNNGIQGFRVEPWLKTSHDDIHIINLNNVLTLSESKDIESIMMHKTFITQSQQNYQVKSKLDRKMGYLTTVNEARKFLEIIYNKSTKEN